MKNDKLAILVLSCDGYADLWRPFFENFKKKWGDCPYDIYLLTNKKKYNDWGKVKTICVGEDVTWSHNLKVALSNISEDFVLTIFDDLFLKKEIDTEKIKDIFNLFKSRKMNYLRLNPTPPPTSMIKGESYGIIDKGDIYRSSAVFSIWRKEILEDILDETENAWDFELNGSLRTDKYTKWFASSDWNLEYYNLVIKGKYDLRIYNKLKKDGIILADSRPVMTFLEMSKRVIQEIRSYVFFFVIPQKCRRFIRNLFR